MEWIRSGYETNDGFGLREGENALGLSEEEQAAWNRANTTNSEEERNAIMARRNARRLREHEARVQARERQAWPASVAGQLLKKLGEAFAEYRDCLEKDPRLADKGLAFDEINQRIFDRMRTNIE